MKRIFQIALVLLLVLGLAGCGATQGDKDNTDSQSKGEGGRDVGEIKEVSLNDDSRIVVFGSDENNFAVTSSLLIRNGNALLVDTKFSKTDAEKIVNYLDNEDYKLTDIFISHGDPDYYFGLEEIKKEYPDVIARSTPATAERITSTVLGKLVVWGEILQDETPQNIVIPEVYEEDNFEFEGLNIEIFGSDRNRTVLYASDLGLILGGPNIVSGNHMFLADMSTDEQRQQWRDSLVELQGLNADVVIPGHAILANENFDGSSIDSSIEYLDAVAEVIPTVQTGAEFIAAMQERYPDLASVAVLEIAGPVLMGEAEWEE